MAGKSVTHSENWWATAAPAHVARCKGSYKSTGEQCRRVAVDGSIVCDQHGGAAGQVRRRAAERIAFTADDAARNLVDWMNDPSVDMRERVKITQDLLDRAGLAAAQVHKVMPINEDPVEALFKSILEDPNGLLPPATADNTVDADFDDDDLIGEVGERNEKPSLPAVHRSPEPLIPPKAERPRNPLTPPKHIREGLELLR